MGILTALLLKAKSCEQLAAAASAKKAIFISFVPQDQFVETAVASSSTGFIYWVVY